LEFIFVQKKAIIYQKKHSIGNTKWTITQFGDNVGSQMMSFTIEGNKNGLVIIDGGYQDNNEQYEFLIEKIKKNNNVVDSWIITHFDSDHGGQFIRIVKEKDIKIKSVYVPDTPEDMELLKENAPFENEWEVYEEYLKLDIPQVVKVHPGDTFKFIDLKMNVLCSYEDWIDQKTDNLMNNGSIVFKIYGNRENLLFCGDVQNKAIEDYLLQRYGPNLKADFLQVGHHGNNNFDEAFYRTVSPRFTFFCAPDWLMENKRNETWYTVKENRALLEKLGAKTFWYNTSPNILEFK